MPNRIPHPPPPNLPAGVVSPAPWDRYCRLGPTDQGFTLWQTAIQSFFNQVSDDAATDPGITPAHQTLLRNEYWRFGREG